MMLSSVVHIRSGCLLLVVDASVDYRELEGKAVNEHLREMSYFCKLLYAVCLHLLISRTRSLFCLKRLCVQLDSLRIGRILKLSPAVIGLSNALSSTCALNCSRRQLPLSRRRHLSTDRGWRTIDILKSCNPSNANSHRNDPMGS